MMGITFEHDDLSSSDSQLMKIDGSALLKLCLENGVTLIKMKTPGKSQVTLEMVVNAGDAPDSKTFAAAFNDKLQIEIVSTNG